MLIVPTGRKDGVLHRYAWATYTIVAINVVFFVLFCVEASDQQRGELVRSWRATIVFLRERPYVKVPATIAELMPSDLRERTPRPDPKVPDWKQWKEQDTVDEMASDLRARYRDVPDVRMSYIPAVGDPLTLFTSMFLHGGFLHLIGNMLFLLAVGPFVENAYGRIAYVILYLSGGVVAALGFKAMYPNLIEPLVGASGAIAAVMGAYLLRFAMSEIEFLFIPIVFLPFWNFTFSVRAIIVLPVWLLEQLVSIPMEGDSGVAVTAHVAGFVYGFVFALALRPFTTETQRAQRVQRTPGRQIPDHLRPALDRALYEDRGDQIDQHGVALLNAYATAGNTAAARDLILEIDPLESRHHLPLFLARAATFAERTGDRPLAISIFEHLCEKEAASASVIPSLVKLATLRRSKGDVAGATEALHRALRHPSCSAEWRRRIETLASGPL